jgi:flagellar basal body P-ring formation protein FlgA
MKMRTKNSYSGSPRLLCKLAMTVLVLNFQFLAFNIAVKANEFSDINDPSFSPDEELTQDLSNTEEILENTVIGKQLENRATPTTNETSLPFDNQPLAETDLQQQKFSLKDSETVIIEEIAEQTGEKNVSVGKLIYKRSDGSKEFTYDQVKNVVLNTKLTLQNLEITENEFTGNLIPTKGDFIIEVKGDFSASIKVPLLTRNINKGSQISQEDVELAYFPKDQIEEDSITEVSSIIGKTATKTLVKGKMVTEDEIRNPTLVAKNSTVSAIYRTDSIEVKALAVALDDGGEGDIIRLKNFDSGKMFKAVVQADGNVLIGASNKDINLTPTVHIDPSTSNDLIGPEIDAKKDVKKTDDQANIDEVNQENTIN